MSDYMYTPDEQQKINTIVDECVDSYRRDETEKFFRQDAYDGLKENVAIKRETFNAIVKERFDEKSSKIIEKHEDIIALNEMIVANTKHQEEDEDTDNE
jgi:hypothetical protein